MSRIEINFNKTRIKNISSYLNIRKPVFKIKICGGSDIRYHFPKNIKYRELIKKIVILDPKYQIPNSISEFKNLNSLKIMKSKKYSDIDYNTFENLEKFTFKNSRLSIMPNVFYTNLKKLDLSNNYLTCIFEEIGNLNNLEHLNLRCNFIKNLPESIYKLEKLTYINLKRNEIKKIEGIFVSENLTYINLSTNSIKIISQLSVSKQLETLNINHNFKQINNIKLNEFDNLKVLKLSNNKFKNFNLKKLEIFVLDKTNNFTKFPKNFCDNINIRVLKINDCPVNKCPKGFHRLKNLEKLFINKTNIKSLPNLYSNKKIKHLNISYNRRLQMPNNVFYLKNLETFEAYDIINNIFPKKLHLAKCLKVLELDPLPVVKNVNFDISKNTIPLKMNLEVPKLHPRYFRSGCNLVLHNFKVIYEGELFYP